MTSRVWYVRITAIVVYTVFMYTNTQYENTSFGIYYGKHPLDMRPLELWGVQGAAAWPVANPVIEPTRLHLQPATNKISNPFIYVASDRLYAFFEARSCETGRTAIGVAESIDAGVNWKDLGLVIFEEHSLFHPFVFLYKNHMFLAADTNGKGVVHLYRAKNFPYDWKHNSTLTEQPLRGVSLVPREHNKKWLLIGSVAKEGEVGANEVLHVYQADSPLGQWQPHPSSPFQSEAASPGGHVFQMGSGLGRVGRTCDHHGVCSGPVALTVQASWEFYEEDEAVANLGRPLWKQHTQWDAAGHDSMAVAELPDGRWIGLVSASIPVSPGVSSMHSMFSVGLFSVKILAMLSGIACAYFAGMRAANSARMRAVLSKSSAGRLIYTQASKDLEFRIDVSKEDGIMASYDMEHLGSHHVQKEACHTGLIRYIKGSCGRSLILGICSLAFATTAVLGNRAVISARPFFRPPRSSVPVHGQHSKFTLMVQSYDSRLENLKLYVQHYSQCPSVGEIVVVWNDGKVLNLAADFSSAVPIRIRTEEKNSMNNRYRPDPELNFRGVLSLDDDLLIPCSSIEAAFVNWRQQPSTLVGFFPRLVEEPYEGRYLYYGEPHAIQKGAYNMILSGAAFIDSWSAFNAYWAPEISTARTLVDTLQNCDDILMNFVVANATKRARLADEMNADDIPGAAHPSPPIQYIRAERRLDVSSWSGVGISHDPLQFMRDANQCLDEFVKLFGGNPLQIRLFDWMEATTPRCSRKDILDCHYD